MRIITLAALVLLVLSGCANLSAGTTTGSATPAAGSSTEMSTENDAGQTAAPSSGTSTGIGKRVAAGGTLADGDIASGELRRAGQKDEFTLDLGDAREFYTADMTGDSIQIDVVNASGETITVGGKILLQYETYPWALTRAGQHKIVIEGQEQDVIGPYSFRLATVKVRTYEVQIGQQIGGGTPPGAGAIDVPGVIERYEFDAAGADQVKLVGGPQSCGDVSFEIRDVSDTDNTSARSPVPFCAPESQPISLDDAGTGRYVLIVRHDHVRTAQYSFRIVRA
ncbi:hypothetical protein [Pseudonocardia aurantiaca]|uniref:Lipoprotein n=1 Tax=Pseudonocardia aurantiaca TaxID=75290 RepID=A0ABW4FM51_9PSEU